MWSHNVTWVLCTQFHQPVSVFSTNHLADINRTNHRLATSNNNNTKPKQRHENTTSNNTRTAGQIILDHKWRHLLKTHKSYNTNAKIDVVTWSFLNSSLQTTLEQQWTIKKHKWWLDKTNRAYCTALHSYQHITYEQFNTNDAYNKMIKFLQNTTSYENLRTTATLPTSHCK